MKTETRNEIVRLASIAGLSGTRLRELGACGGQRAIQILWQNRADAEDMRGTCVLSDPDSLSVAIDRLWPEVAP